MTNKYMIKFKIFNILTHKGNSNQNYLNPISLQSEWQSSRKQITTHAGEDVGEFTGMISILMLISKANMEVSTEVHQKLKWAYAMILLCHSWAHI
jgi:hypothetical protein